MAAVLNQQVVGILQRFVHIKAGNAPARALSDAVVNADDQRRPVILFYQPRRRDADNAGMPVLPVGDEHAVVPSLLRFNLLYRLTGDVVFYILPFFIQLVQLFGNAPGFFLIRFQQKAHALFGVADAAGGVEARRRRKSDAAGADRIRRQARYGQQRLKARIIAFFHPLQSVANDDAVFPRQGN